MAASESLIPAAEGQDEEKTAVREIAEPMTYPGDNMDTIRDTSEPAPNGTLQRPRRRWVQWSLRTLLVAITLLAVGPGGWIVFERNRMEREAAAIARLQPSVQVYVRPSWLWTSLAGRSAGPVVGLCVHDMRPGSSESLATFSELVWLDLNDHNVTDADLASLARLQRLERLRLDETQVTSAGLAQLADLPRLHMLNLYGTPVDDAGLVHLARLPKLKTLYVQKTQMTDAGLRRLRQSRPNLSIDR